MPTRPDTASSPLDHLAWLSSRFLLIAAALVVAGTGLVVAGVVVLPLFLGLLITAGVDPIAHRLRDRGAPPALASLGAVGTIVAALALLGVVTVGAVVDQWPSISATIGDAVEQLEDASSDHLDVAPATAEDTGTDVREAVGSIVGALARGVVRLVPTVAGWVTALGLSIVVAFFFLRDGRGMWRAGLALAPDDDRAAFEAATRDAWQAVAGFVRGTALIAVVDGTIIGLGAWVLGVPSPLAITLFTIAAAFIPVLGATFAGTFAVLLALGAEGFATAMAMLAVVLLVQQLEGNFLQPVVLSRTTALHPLVTMLSVVAGGAFGGVIGMLLAVPMTAGAVAAVRALRRFGWPDGNPTPTG